MNIIYEALERPQTTVVKTQDLSLDHKMTRDDWIDVAIALGIAFLLGVLIVAHYPSIQKNSSKQQITLSATPLATPAKAKITETATVTSVKSEIEQTTNNAPVNPKLEELASIALEKPQVNEASNLALVEPKHEEVINLLLDKPKSVTNVALAKPETQSNIKAAPVKPQAAVVAQASSNKSEAIETKPTINNSDYVTNHVLNGIFLSEQEKVVMINNHFYTIGDMVDGMKIVAVNEDSIKLENEKGIIELHIAIS